MPITAISTETDYITKFSGYGFTIIHHSTGEVEIYDGSITDSHQNKKLMLSDGSWKYFVEAVNRLNQEVNKKEVS